MTTIYHNPRCSKSRQTLKLIEEQSIKPTIVLYLETPLDYATIEGLLKQLGINARDLLRKGEDTYKENQLSNSALSEKELIDAMVKFPKLIERPIVVNKNKAVLGRPPENVLAIL